MPAAQSITETRWLPACVRETVLRFEREFERKEGMIADIHQLANDNHGLDPEDCDALVRHVRDRDDIKTALDCIDRIFS